MKEILRMAKRIIFRFKGGNYFYFMWLFPIKSKKIVFSNYQGKGYGDSPKAIAEVFSKYQDYDLVWLVDKKLTKNDFPNSIRIVRQYSFRGLYEMATSKIWIDNCRKFFYPPKRKSQIYLQTWHGSLALKKIEADAEAELSHVYVKCARADSKMCDYILSNSQFSDKLYKDKFWFDGEILKFGTPRSDIFNDLDGKIKISKNVYEYYNIEHKKKLVLYAPTFRKNSSTESYIKDFTKILTSLSSKFKEDFVVGYRLHPNIANIDVGVEWSNQVINMSGYADIQDLLIASEILITDYSSSMFETLITEKLCYVYGKDLDEYKSNNRGLYFNFEELPFLYSESEEDLVEKIGLTDYNIYLKKISEFKRSIGLEEIGNSSTRTVEFLINKIESE